MIKKTHDMKKDGRTFQTGERTLIIDSSVPLPGLPPSPLPSMEAGESFAVTHTDSNFKWIKNLVSIGNRHADRDGTAHHFIYRCKDGLIRVWRSE